MNRLYSAALFFSTALGLCSAYAQRPEPAAKPATASAGDELTAAVQPVTASAGTGFAAGQAAESGATWISRPAAAPPSTEKAINWLGIDEALRANEKKKGAKPIFIDLYTDWCGWCKRLDATTFQHAFIVDYLNEHYHAVKFNAEKHGPVNYDGAVLEMAGNGRDTHPFAVRVGSQRGQIGYPTLVILDVDNKKLITLPGYYNAERLEPILVYYAEGYHKELDFETFQGMYTPQGKP